jgi:anti-anti-sigma regulatory factor
MKYEQFTVTSRLDGDTAVIYPRGYLNNLAGETLVSECGGYTGRGVKKLVLNFSETGLINTVGISMLLQIMDNLRNIEGTVCFTNMSGFQRETFDILGLLKYLTVFQTEGEALTYLGSSRT